MKQIIIPITILVLFYSCTKPETGTVSRDTIIFYEKKTNTSVVYQVYKFEDSVETNLTNELNHNYWWTKVNTAKTKFLCYQSPRYASNNGQADYENASLMCFNIDGSNPRTLIAKGQYGWHAMGVAKWSPDGTKILMAAYCKDSVRGFNNIQWRLVVTDANGSNPVIISTQNKVYADPAWSPDGNRIVYVSLPPNGDSTQKDALELYVADYDKVLNQVVNETRLTNDNIYPYDPHWSHDGKYIAFSNCKAIELFNPFGKCEIYRISPDGTDEKVIMQDDKINGVPYWAPDNKEVYFHTLGFGLSFSIARCDGINGQDKKIVLLGGGAEGAMYSTPQVVQK